MNEKPAYFECIRREAAQIWDDLKRKPKLAGPWHQMFEQVRNPRHVLSELLQNADDAGADQASVRIKDQAFIFEHNGEDFTEEHLESLCGFGHSNKRTLHTIGFRGIGFKSTFSLGDRVELFTPSLSIAFHSKRFTEPEWIESVPRRDGLTCVRVKISDQHRQQEMEKNLEEWIKNPVSLLFFRNIRRIRIGDRKIIWKDRGAGPVPESRQMALHGQAKRALLIQSKEEEFPEDALDEIRQGRTLDDIEEMEFPPCRVEIVLETREPDPSSKGLDAISAYGVKNMPGAQGRLYVVLPTGVKTTLPFACNAPFIPNPDRLEIKNPAMSPTNRWLLERIGDLAASAMFRWLGRRDVSLAERSGAYGLFPDRNQLEYGLDGACSTIIRDAFAKAIEGQDILLTEDGQIVPKEQSLIIPPLILDVWSTDQIAGLLDTGGRPALCSSVEESDRRRLLQWGVIDEIDQQDLFDALVQRRPPKPTWSRLLILWAYLASGDNYYLIDKNYNIVPVQGKDKLYAASEVVRLGDKKILQSNADSKFLAKHLLILNPNWPRFLAERRLVDLERGGSSARSKIESAYAILGRIELDGASDASKTINQAAKKFFHGGSTIQLADCVRLARIAAKLGASMDDEFLYVTRDLSYRSGQKGTVLFDEDGKLEDLLPEDRRKSQLLHNDYSKPFISCSRSDWKEWIASGRAKIRTFVPMIPTSTHYYSKEKIEREGHRRGLYEVFSYPYKKERFIVEDWDFDEDCWDHWEELAASDGNLWVRLAELLLDQEEIHWINARSARFFQETANGSKKSLTATPILPQWARRLRDLPCLPDEHGIPHRPVDLLRLTSKTAPVTGVEPFIANRLDQVATRPLLNLLGVRSTPTGPNHLLERLRALAEGEDTPVHEVEKWYRRLDQMLDSCSTADQQRIKQALRDEKLILTHGGAWTTSATVFISSNEEDVPGAEMIMKSVRGLALWSKIGVNERPTADLAIKWLKSLTAGTVPPPDDARRVQTLLGRHPGRIWAECGFWLNLVGEWSPVDGLFYALTEQSHIQWRTLHPWVQKRTADLRRLQSEDTRNEPFSKLTPLESIIENCLQKDQHSTTIPTKGAWLRTLGNELRRVNLDSEEDADSVRVLADRLAKTEWLETSELEMIPYIDGKPAGPARQASVTWHDRGIYVNRQLSDAELARLVPEEIGRSFTRPDIKAVLYYSFERSDYHIQEYLKANFSLDTAVDPPSEEDIPNIDGESDPETEHTPIVTGTTESEMQDNGEDGKGGNDGASSPTVRRVKTPKQSIMEHFAVARGFKKNGDAQFYRGGSRIQKATDTRFPWALYNASGDLVCYYLPIERCLEQETFEIAADIWGLIEKHPDKYALVLRNVEGEPKELSGSRLVSMRKKNQVVIYPATYMLEYKG